MRSAALVAAVAAVAVTFVVARWPENEDRLQKHLDEKYGLAEYNVIGCDENLLDESVVECVVAPGRREGDESWRVVVEFDGDGVRNLRGMPSSR